MRPQAILFDLDITLIDRTQSIQRYAAHVQRHHTDNLVAATVADIAAAIAAADADGYRPREAMFAELVQCLPWQTPPTVTRLQRHWETWFPASSVAREGLVETLCALHTQGIRLGIVTNGAVQRQHAKITHLQILPYLSTIVISEAARVKKPDPRIFAQALTEIGCTASQTWFVGDHPLNDVLGAAASGMRAIWLAGFHSWPTAQPEPQWHIRSLCELVEMVHREQHSPGSGC
jgi:putative hydrolase of the HAD superfamily